MITQPTPRQIGALRIVPRDGRGLDYSGPERALLNKLIFSGYVTSYMRQYTLTEKGEQALADFDATLSAAAVETLRMAVAGDAATLHGRSYSKLLDAGLISIGFATGKIYAHEDAEAIVAASTHAHRV